MPEPVRLRIACHRHPPDHSLSRQAEQLETHLAVEGALQLGVFGRDLVPVADRSHEPQTRTPPPFASVIKPIQRLSPKVSHGKSCAQVVRHTGSVDLGSERTDGTGLCQRLGKGSIRENEVKQFALMLSKSPIQLLMRGNLE
jgi:hypothetical protein